MDFENETKQLIFKRSVQLFADLGFSEVSMKMIATACGIQPSSIYNHFSSKEALLDAIYDYYLLHIHDMRPTPEQYLPILRGGTPEEIINVFNYPMPDEQEGEFTMFGIVRIIFGRMYTDARAQSIYREETVEAGIAYIHEVLTAGIEMGRIVMDAADLLPVATIILSSRTFAAGAVVLQANQPLWRANENQMMALMARLIDFNPPLA